jgi:hydroxyacylglutathione hydrolase
MTMPKVRWFDDWFAIDEIAPGLFGIGEPKYHQINWNYLIVGQERAL